MSKSTFGAANIPDACRGFLHLLDGAAERSEARRQEETLFRTIKAKLLVLIIGMSVLTALVVAFFATDDITREIMKTEHESMRNAVYLVKLNIENIYENLLFDKMATLEKRKNSMKDVSSVVKSGVERFLEAARRGSMSQKAARESALNWVKSLKYGTGSYVFVFDEKGIVLTHPNPAMAGKEMSSVRDVKGLPVFTSVAKALKEEEGKFAAFSWVDPEGEKVSKKLGYFVDVPQIGWIIGTVCDIQDLELEVHNKMQATLKDLRQTFDKIIDANIGQLFLFNGKKELLIHKSLSGKDMAETGNPLTGNLLLDDMMAAARQPDKPLEYLSKSPSGRGDPVPYDSYIDYVKPLDWYIVSVTPKDEMARVAQTVVLRLILMITAVFAVSIFAMYLMLRKISQPLNTLAGYAKELPTHDFTKDEEGGSLIEEYPRKYRDEVGRLAESFLFMEQALHKYIENLKETTAAKQRIESDLMIARSIQMSFLPKIFPPFPDRDEFELYSLLESAKEVGGDLYDFFLIDENHLFFNVGDVSDKGVPAALFMAVTQTLMKSTAQDGRFTPAEILERVNLQLFQQNESLMFVTLFCGILDIRTGMVVYSNAGHNPPVVIRASCTAEWLDLPEGLVLGVSDDVKYENRTLQLMPGDMIVSYTDGVTEAMNPAREQYTEERLVETVIACASECAEIVVKRIKESVSEFAGGATQSDDITILSLRYKSSHQDPVCELPA